MQSSFPERIIRSLVLQSVHFFSNSSETVEIGFRVYQIDTEI